MKPQSSEQNGSSQNGEGAADAVSVATIPTGEASAASTTDLTVSKSSQQLKLEMLNMELASNGSGEFSGRYNKQLVGWFGMFSGSQICAWVTKYTDKNLYHCDTWIMIDQNNFLHLRQTSPNNKVLNKIFFLRFKKFWTILRNLKFKSFHSGWKVLILRRNIFYRSLFVLFLFIIK